jgi:lipopolysaccharide export system permease protein
MRLLKRYVLKKFLAVYALTLISLISVFLLVDFFERVDEFLVKGSTLFDLFAYYFYKIPFIFFFIAPQAVLLATVVTLAAFARNNEFTAMKACGIGVTGITIPIVLAAFLIAIAVVVCNEYVAPEANRKMNYIFNVKVRGRQPMGAVQRDKLWFRSANGWLCNVNYYDPNKSLMKRVSLFIYGKDNRLERRIDAAAAIWNGKEWEFTNGYTRDFGPDEVVNTQYFDREIFPLPETPKDLNKAQKKPEEMSVSEMYRDIKATSTEGKDSSRMWVDLHHKFSYPFIGVVLALIGIPLSLRSNRSGGVLFSVGLSLGLGFAFSFIYAMGISLGHGGTFSPFLAAWGPNIIFSCIGFYLLLTLDSTKIIPI